MAADPPDAGAPRLPLRVIGVPIGLVAAASALAQPWLPDTDFVERAPLVIVALLLWTILSFHVGRRVQWRADRTRWMRLIEQRRRSLDRARPQRARRTARG